MNHLIISPNSPFISVGGIERHIQNLIDFYKNKSGNFYFLLPYSSKTATEHIQVSDNVEIIFLKSLNLSYGARKGTNKKTIAHKTIQKKSHDFFTFLNTFLEEKQINRVIAQNFHLGLPPAYSLMLNMACFARDIPVFLRIHSFSTNDLQTSIINDLLWKKVICVSKSVAGDCFHKGLDIKRIHTRYLGVDLHEFNPSNTSPSLKKKLNLSKDTKIILSASRILQGYTDILKEKGILNLLDAYARIAKRYPKTHYYLLLQSPQKN